MGNAKFLVKLLRSTTDGRIPRFTSDAMPHYANALLEEHGMLVTPPRKPGPGRPPLARKVPPEDLRSAVVGKRRENGHLAEVSTHIVYGTPEQITAAIEASPVSATISTYGVERNNFTIRQHSRRVGRQVNAFSKERDYLEDQLTLSFAYYHFVVRQEAQSQSVPLMEPCMEYARWLGGHAGRPEAQPCVKLPRQGGGRVPYLCRLVYLSD